MAGALTGACVWSVCGMFRKNTQVDSVSTVFGGPGWACVLVPALTLTTKIFWGELLGGPSVLLRERYRF